MGCCQTKSNVDFQTTLNVDLKSYLKRRKLYEENEFQGKEKLELIFKVEQDFIAFFEKNSVKDLENKGQYLYSMIISWEGKHHEETHLKELFQKISNVPNLMKLDLNIGNSNLLDDGAKALGSTLSLLTNLRLLHLDLSSNSITDFGVKAISEGISCCRRLMNVSINLTKNNDTEDSGVSLLCEGLSKIPNLISIVLNLQETNLGDVGMKNLSIFLGHYEGLQKLDLNLYKNNVTKEGFMFFALNLPRNSWLTSFSLNADDNKTDDETFSVLFEKIGYLIYLIDLNLYLDKTNVSNYKKMFESLNKLNLLLNLNLEYSRYKCKLKLQHLVVMIENIIKSRQRLTLSTYNLDKFQKFRVFGENADTIKKEILNRLDYLNHLF